jgi:hypothetical protein
MHAPRLVRSPVRALLLAAFLLAGCGKEAPPSSGAPGAGASATPGAGAGTVAVSPYALAVEPKGTVAVSVLEAKAAGAKKDVAVVGRVREITPGFAAFTLTDVALTYCGQTEKEGCENPWDYCCHDTADIAKHTIAVAVKTPGGEVVAAPSLPELRNLDLVVVVGELVKGADGEVTLVAKGWHRRERPALPASVRFP